MTEEFDPEDDHRMYELEHLRSETTMIDRPPMLPTPSLPGEVAQPAPISQEPQPAFLQSDATAASSPEIATSAPASEQVSLTKVVGACLACLAMFAICYLIVRYAL